MSKPLISVRGLTKKFGDFTAVDGIDFDVAKGESFGLLGPNGAGKPCVVPQLLSCLQQQVGLLFLFHLSKRDQHPFEMKVRNGLAP